MRSGCVISSLARRHCRRSISPSGVTETTLGTSLSPSTPGMTRARSDPCTATRLLVVPRSMPTMWPVGVDVRNQSGRWTFSSSSVYFAHQIRDVFPPVQQHRESRRAASRDPARHRTCANSAAAAASISARMPAKRFSRLLQLRTRGIVAAPQLFQRHVQLEDFFQQLRRHIFGRCSPISKPSSFSRYSRALNGISQRPISVVQQRRHIQRLLLLAPRLRA